MMVPPIRSNGSSENSCSELEPIAKTAGQPQPWLGAPVHLRFCRHKSVKLSVIQGRSLRVCMEDGLFSYDERSTTLITEQQCQASISAQMRSLAGLFQAFQGLTTSAGASIAGLKQTDTVEPAFDCLCHRLERDCAGLQAGLDTMRDIIDLLPIHAVITRLFPNYCAYLGEQELWNLERVAREVYESLLLAGANEGLAYDGAHAACVAHALKQLGGQDFFDLPDDMCWLIQGVLMQVKMLLNRRRVMQP